MASALITSPALVPELVEYWEVQIPPTAWLVDVDTGVVDVGGGLVDVGGDVLEAGGVVVDAGGVVVDGGGVVFDEPPPPDSALPPPPQALSTNRSITAPARIELFMGKSLSKYARSGSADVVSQRLCNMRATFKRTNLDAVPSIAIFS